MAKTLDDFWIKIYPPGDNRKTTFHLGEDRVQLCLQETFWGQFNHVVKWLFDLSTVKTDGQYLAVWAKNNQALGLKANEVLALEIMYRKALIIYIDHEGTIIFDPEDEDTWFNPNILEDSEGAAKDYVTQAVTQYLGIRLGNMYGHTLTDKVAYGRRDRPIIDGDYYYSKLNIPPIVRSK